MDKMAILGIGTDICNIGRIEKIYDTFKDKFLTRIFSDDECYAFGKLSENKKIPFLAKRFAAKEAIAKALQTGIGQHAYFTEITCLGGGGQPPHVILIGKTHQTALRLAQINNYATYHIHISLSDDTDYALAFTILTGTQLTGTQ
jgi:holo-[acyl-carrier protein] synthase